MSNETANEVFTAEWALRRLAERHAYSMDRNVPEILDSIYWPDAVMLAPGFEIKGIEQIRTLPGMLRDSYEVTAHLIHQQVMTISGDTATGETFCTASAVQKGEGKVRQCTATFLRYRETCVRRHGEWKFARREVAFDWSQTHTIDYLRT